MLARVANNLFWMGRYLERAEHLARYMKEMYFSSLDTPIDASSTNEFILNSMLYMAGDFELEEVNERTVLYKLGLDRGNPASILSTITYGRENCRGARNVIPLPLWEAVNKYYHFIHNYSSDAFTSTGLFDLTQNVIEMSQIVQSKINSILLHNEVRSIILLGIHLERVHQILRIINAKLHDIYELEEKGIEVGQLSFEWSTLLKCADAFDMSKTVYSTVPNRKETLEFLILNKNCPRSVVFGLRSIRKYLLTLGLQAKVMPNTPEFEIGKLVAKFDYMLIDDIEDDVYSVINDTMNKLEEIALQVDQTYLNY